MNKYEKLINALKIEYDTEYEKYVSEMKSNQQKAQKYCHSYNDQIHRINATKDTLLEGMTILYDFLKRLGVTGEKISAFDYTTESSHFVENDIYNASNFNNANYTTPGILKTASVISIVSAPTLLPVIWVGDSIRKRSKDKEEYLKMTEEFESEKTKWSKAITDKKREVKFYEDISKIAFLYQSLILTVKQAIKETILPELAGIDAFLIADAIKESIISGTNPEDSEVLNISIYEGTAYDMHYIFVRNTFDYYTTIVKIFTESILTKLVSKNSVTPVEKKAFEMKVLQIEKQQKLLEDTTVFGGTL